MHNYTDEQITIMNEIIEERKYQDERHDFPHHFRMAILAEEVGEVACALQDGNEKHLIDELIQVAAVCVRWIEHIRADIQDEHDPI